jgi:hypothetical protein
MPLGYLRSRTGGAIQTRRDGGTSLNTRRPNGRRQGGGGGGSATLCSGPPAPLPASVGASPFQTLSLNWNLLALALPP